MSNYVLTQTFAGFMLSTAQTAATLSTTADTVVDVQVYLSSASGNPPQPIAVAGGFKVLDPSSGSLVNYESTVVQNAPDPAQPLAWNVRLVFAAHPSAPTILVRAYATYATFVAMP